MSGPKKALRNRLVQLWEQAVLYYQQFRSNPSLQLAWKLAKTLGGIMLWLVKLYFKHR